MEIEATTATVNTFDTVGMGRATHENVAGFSLFRQLADIGDSLPPWWSPERDAALQRAWKDGQHLSGVVGHANAKFASIPFRVEVTDFRDEAALDVAKVFNEIISRSGLGVGYHDMMSRFANDFLTRDNGAFMEILDSDQSTTAEMPRRGFGGLRHLDSSRCLRTNMPEFPIYYHGEDHKEYRVHRSRVIYMSRLTSPETKMNGVGYCSVSSAVRIGQDMVNIYNHKARRTGSAPSERLIIGKGIKSSEIVKAIAASQKLAEALGIEGLEGSAIIGGDTNLDVAAVDLHSFPEFDERAGIELGLLALSLAFGLQPNEIMQLSGSKSSDLVSLQRARTQLPHEFRLKFLEQFQLKVLEYTFPGLLKAVMEMEDAQADQQRAVILDINTRAWQRQQDSGILSPQGTLTDMYSVGAVSENVFTTEMRELGSKRDGNPILEVLVDDRYFPLLTVPRDITVRGVYTPEEAWRLIDEQIVVARYVAANFRWNPYQQDMARDIVRAMEEVNKLYPAPEEEEEEEEEGGILEVIKGLPTDGLQLYEGLAIDGL